MSQKSLYILIAVILVVLAGFYFLNQSGAGSTTPNNEDQALNSDNDMASDTDMTATDTSVTTDTTASGSSVVKNIPGYPTNWPSDVPKYPVDKVTYTTGNVAGQTGKKAGVVFKTTSSVSSVKNFYLTGLANSGWKITENGNGLSNLITLRAAKGTREVGVYIERTATTTNVTVGVNIGL
jgi:hypothetical protein